jgi:hypothetical protein
MLNNIKQQLTELSIKHVNMRLSPSMQHKKYQPEMTIKNCIEIIFEYYCKQSYTAGKNPTFDRIQH